MNALRIMARNRRGFLAQRVLQTRAMLREIKSRGGCVSWRKLDYGDVRMIVTWTIQASPLRPRPSVGMATYEGRTLRACLRGAL